MDTENENTVIVGIRMKTSDVKDLKQEAKQMRISLSGLIRQRVFKQN